MGKTQVHRLLLPSVLLAAGLACTGCLPMVSNIAKGEIPSKAVRKHVPENSALLVLPLWSDHRSYNFRNPYVIPASAIGTPEAEVPARVTLWFDALVCGGPTEWIDGYLIVTEGAKFIWSVGLDDKWRDGRDTSLSGIPFEEVSEAVDLLSHELETLVSGGESGPALRELIRHESGKLRFKGDKGERALVLSFLAQISNSSASVSEPASPGS